MTRPTDDLAAQMVREIHDTGCIAIHFSDFAALEAIARRYMEKAEDKGALEALRWVTEVIGEGQIARRRAGKEPPHDH